MHNELVCRPNDGGSTPAHTTPRCSNTQTRQRVITNLVDTQTTTKQKFCTIRANLNLSLNNLIYSYLILGPKITVLNNYSNSLEWKAVDKRMAWKVFAIVGQYQKETICHIMWTGMMSIAPISSRNVTTMRNSRLRKKFGTKNFIAIAR